MGSCLATLGPCWFILDQDGVMSDHDGIIMSHLGASWGFMGLMEGSWVRHGGLHGFPRPSKHEKTKTWVVLERVGRGKPLPWEEGFRIVFVRSRRPAPYPYRTWAGGYIYIYIHMYVCMYLCRESIYIYIYIYIYI